MFMSSTGNVFLASNSLIRVMAMKRGKLQPFLIMVVTAMGLLTPLLLLPLIMPRPRSLQQLQVEILKDHFLPHHLMQKAKQNQTLPPHLQQDLITTVEKTWTKGKRSIDSDGFQTIASRKRFKPRQLSAGYSSPNVFDILHDIPSPDTIAAIEGYSCFYGGKEGSYSGVLTLIRNTLQPTWLLDHVSGRCSVFTVDSPWGYLQIINLYTHNEGSARISLWNWLTHLQIHQGILVGDFNMVLSLQDTTSVHTVIPAFEIEAWDKMSAGLHIEDVWHGVNNSPGYSFHSKSHIASWSRLDRLYSLGANGCPTDVLLKFRSKWHYLITSLS